LRVFEMDSLVEMELDGNEHVVVGGGVVATGTQLTPLHVKPSPNIEVQKPSGSSTPPHPPTIGGVVVVALAGTQLTPLHVNPAPDKLVQKASGSWTPPHPPTGGGVTDAARTQSVPLHVNSAPNILLQKALGS
jgi:hypothetical protein